MKLQSQLQDAAGLAEASQNRTYQQLFHDLEQAIQRYETEVSKAIKLSSVLGLDHNSGLEGDLSQRSAFA